MGLTKLGYQFIHASIWLIRVRALALVFFVKPFFFLKTINVCNPVLRPLAATHPPPSQSLISDE